MENRAIKCVIILVMSLFIWGFFYIGEIKAITFTENFDNYNVGDLTGQGGWITPFGNQSCWVDNIKAYSFPYSISVKNNYASCGAEKEWVTATEGYFTFNFYGETKETGNNILIFFNTSVLQLLNEVIYVGGSELPNSNWSVERWHTVGIEFNTEEGWIRGRFDINNWTATTSFTGPFEIVNFIYQNGFRNKQDFFLDNFKLVGSYDEYTYEELGLPELPELEECGELGITDRLLCELKNFFYRLFVPSPEKITELRSSLDTIKTKFPYNYVLEIKNFFTYIKDNINENETTFKILGQEGTINFAFWNATTTLANSTQSFVDIFKKITTFIIILLFGFWLLTFLRRIFK